MADDRDENGDDAFAENAGETADKEALFHELYAYKPFVIGFLNRYGFSGDKLNDLVQDVFLRVFQHMGTYRGQARLGWIQPIVRTIALNEIRKQHAVKREAETVSLDDVTEMPNQPGRNPDGGIDAKEASKRILKAVRELPEKYRTIMMLYLAERSYREMSADLGISVSSVKSRLHAARDQLRESLGEPDGLGVPDDH
ncbi:MAG: hypothetical protein QOF63_1105 [Thermoanaerobaculia bacterium]|jgi:RNA polymerase sigma-70 factor (ECF subfamily)|nr:hypothetical protein [Thermoanaerobaculia bacterium]